MLAVYALPASAEAGAAAGLSGLRAAGVTGSAAGGWAGGPPVPGLLLPCLLVSFEVRQGEILGIVGETGSGKSALARAILQAPRPDPPAAGKRCQAFVKASGWP